MNDLFYGTTGPRDARIMLVGEAWGKEEARRELAFQGQAGQELDRILADAGIARNECLCTNLVAFQPQDNKLYRCFHSNQEAKAWNLEPHKGLYPDPQMLDGINRLHLLITAVKPWVIVCFGNYPTWALTAGVVRIGKAQTEKGEPSYAAPTGVTQWRGSQLRTEHSYLQRDGTTKRCRLVPCIHPAAILRQWSWRVDTVHDLRARVAPNIRSKLWQEPEYKFTIRPDAKQTYEILDYLWHLPPSHRIARDIETYAGHISCIGLAWSARDAICIPFRTQSGQHYFTAEEEFTIRRKLAKLMRHNRAFCLQNAVYDLQYEEAELLGYACPAFDTMLAQHLLWPGRRKALGYISSLYNEFHSYWKDEAEWSDDESKEIDPDLGDEILWTYNCKDCCATWEAAGELEKIIAHFGMQSLMQERMDQLDLAMQGTFEGILIDPQERSQQRTSILRQRIDYEAFLSQCMPSEIISQLATKSAKAPWYQSPIQQMRLFYDELHFPERFDRKRKTRTLDDDALRQIEAQEPLMQPVCRALRDLRSLTTYYTNHLSAEIDPDGYMRCTNKVAGPYTFRWATAANAFGRGTNLQNVPADKGDRG